MRRTKLKHRILPEYTKGEEIFNMVSHIVGGGLGITALVWCVVISAIKGDPWGIGTSIVYGITMILLYTMSSIYHGLKNELAKKVFQVLDHCSIYLLIAGSYTPILLCSIRLINPWVAWVIFGIEWALTILAVTLNAVDLRKFRTFAMICNILLGWAIIFVFPIVIEALQFSGFSLLMLGGLFYTVGVVFYALGKKKKYFHSIFHLFVLGGSISHLLCIIYFVL